MVKAEIYYSLLDHNMYVSLLALLIISAFEIASGGWFNLRLPFFSKGREERMKKTKNSAYDAVGLWNLGNTCYANAVIQALYHCSSFRKQVFTENFVQNSIGESVQSLFQNMQSKESNIVDTTDLLQKLQVNVNIQEDAQEFLLKLVNNIEESIESSGRNKELLPITTSSVMVGEIEYIYDCVEVNFTKARKQRFLTLSLDMYNFTNIDDSLAKFFGSEFLVGDNKYNTKSHGLQDTEKSCRISRFPDVLCIHLKRFSYDFAMGKLRKVGKYFEFPFDLNMNHSNSKNTSNVHLGRNYTLKSIVIHDGEANSGHYTCIVNAPDEKSMKKTKNEMNGSRWLNLNDHDISFISDDDVRRIAFGDPGSTSYKSKNAYLLLYSAM